MRDIKLLSIVVPCHNEEEVLNATNKRLRDVLNGLVNDKKTSTFEIVYVDNGSTDNTLNVLKDIYDSSKNIKIIALRRNFGYQGSISAGLYYAKGDAVITIDADLQDPPEKIGEMIQLYENGYDLVLGVRNDRSTDSFLKKIFSESYYNILKLFGVEVVHNHGDFRLMAKGLVDIFNSLPERNRFIRAMILQLDSKYAVVHYKREKRIAGKTKFNISSLLSFSIDGIVSFSYMPLRLASLVGFILCFLSMIGVLWVLYIKLYSRSLVPGWASTLLPIFFIGGFQLLVLGIVGEYIGKLYIEIKQRPLFIVREVYRHDR
ncbi:MAG: glycosyltransferase [Elusimicrobia bacterium CG_4_10_14_0_8_um_filter_37_32]|nr:MAG: glycosyltransferase [Elusimicrobia bacterium CG02_land_8_20_14_3_00_37_13]PIZ13353.1 MAG: glycosyltransferase [Elusimicrobia bacterium CG_4_10_14_0_8_um_filter_37_32]